MECGDDGEHVANLRLEATEKREASAPVATIAEDCVVSIVGNTGVEQKEVDLLKATVAKMTAVGNIKTAAVAHDKKAAVGNDKMAAVANDKMAAVGNDKMAASVAKDRMAAEANDNMVAVTKDKMAEDEMAAVANDKMSAKCRPLDISGFNAGNFPLTQVNIGIVFYFFLL